MEICYDMAEEESNPSLVELFFSPEEGKEA